MTVILALAALAAASAFGMVVGVGLYRAGQVRAYQQANNALQHMGHLVAYLESELENAMEEVDAWMSHGGPPVDKEPGSEAAHIDVPSQPISDAEYEAFWRQVEGDTK